MTLTWCVCVFCFKCIFYCLYRYTHRNSAGKYYSPLKNVHVYVLRQTYDFLRHFLTVLRTFISATCHSTSDICSFFPKLPNIFTKLPGRNHMFALFSAVFYIFCQYFFVCMALYCTHSIHIIKLRFVFDGGPKEYDSTKLSC